MDENNITEYGIREALRIAKDNLHNFGDIYLMPDDTFKKARQIDLWIRDKYSGHIHKVGDDPHDCLMVDEEGTVKYYNLQNSDGCTGYKSINEETLADRFPDKDWNKRSGEFTSGYEFVPNIDEEGFPYDPTKEQN